MRATTWMMTMCLLVAPWSCGEDPPDEPNGNTLEVEDVRRVSATIPTSGGGLVSIDQKLAIMFPDGAFSEAAEVTITLGTPIPSAYFHGKVGRSYEITADQLLQAAARLSFVLSPEDVTSLGGPSKIGAYTFSTDGEPLKLVAGNYEGSLGVYNARTAHLSVFALIENAATSVGTYPACPNGDECVAGTCDDQICLAVCDLDLNQCPVGYTCVDHMCRKRCTSADQCGGQDCCVSEVCRWTERCNDPASCIGYCGRRRTSCSCSSDCVTLGDCCADVAPVCWQGEPDSCVGLCGPHLTRGGCWCGNDCRAYGDCCPDFETACPGF